MEEIIVLLARIATALETSNAQYEEWRELNKGWQAEREERESRYCDQQTEWIAWQKQMRQQSADLEAQHATQMRESAERLQQTFNDRHLAAYESALNEQTDQVKKGLRLTIGPDLKELGATLREQGGMRCD